MARNYTRSTTHCTHLIIIIVGDHDEELHGESFWGSLGNEHVLGPSTPAEVELRQGVSTLWSVQVQVAEGTLEWYGYGGVGGSVGYGVLALFH